MARDDFAIQGADQFLRLSKALKAAGQTEVRKELNKALRDATKPLIVETRAAAGQRLPQRGGLARRMSKAPQRVKVSTGRDPGVSIVLKAQPGIKNGTIRHPVFGGPAFVTQRVDGTWWDDTLEAGAPRVLPEIEKALAAVARQVLNQTKPGA